MLICLPFMITPSITDMSSLMDQYGLMFPGIWPTCNYNVLQPLQVLLLLSGLLDLSYGHAFCYNGCHLYWIYPNVQTIDCLIFILPMVLPGQPVCNKNFWSCFVYYTYPVLMDSQDDVLDSPG